MSDLHITKTPKGRKQYKCEACGYMISKGERHVQNEGFYEGESYRYRVHNECNDELFELSIAGEFEFSPFELDPPERLKEPLEGGE